MAQVGEERGRGKAKRLVPDADLQEFIGWAWWTGIRKREISRLTWDAYVRDGVQEGRRAGSTFDRYNIVAEEDLRAAVKTTAEYVSALPRKRTTAALRKTTGR